MIGRLAVLGLTLASCVRLCGQTESPISPEFLADGRIILRAVAPQANRVLLNSGVITRAAGVSGTTTIPYGRRKDGLWELILPPLPANIYNYTLLVDAAPTLDVLNPAVQVNSGPAASELVVSDGQQYFDLRAVPHGTVTRLVYHSPIIEGPRELFIYTPPGYDSANTAITYPVLYLFGGNGQRAHSWIITGRLDRIADNLLAGGVMQPMIIVMPDAHDVAISDAMTDIRGNVSQAERERRLEADLLGSVLPLVEREYRVRRDRHGRALAGLSLGAAMTDAIGLEHLDRFASFGLFSGGGGAFAQRHAELLSHPETTNKQIDLLLLGCGRSDRGPFEQLDALHQLLTTAGVHHLFWADSAEAHNWLVWRPLIARAFLPKLFRTPIIVTP